MHRNLCGLGAGGALALFGGAAQGVVMFTNGSMDGAAGVSMVPTSWINLPEGTTDTVIPAAGHPFSSFAGQGIGAIPYPASSDGGTFAWSADYFQDAGGQPEGLRQTVLGLTAGATYEIEFEFANLGLYDPSGGIATNAFNAGQNYGSAGRWIVRTGILQIGATPVVDYAAAGQQVWQKHKVVFVAPQATIEFRFEANWASGNGTHVGMGLDGLVIREIPAPGVLSVVGMLGIAGTRRRR